MKNLRSEFLFVARLVFIALMVCTITVALNAQIKPERNQAKNDQYEKMVPLDQILKKDQSRDPGNPEMEHCRCINSIVQNGTFSEGSETGGNIPSLATVDYWNRGTNTPQYKPGMGYSSPGFIYLWGNQVVSESIWQKVNFEEGKRYKGCFAFKYIYSHKTNPSKHIRFKLIASKSQPLNTPQCPSETCTVITTSQTIVESDGWQVHFFENWISDDDYYYLYITPENDQAIDGAEYISHGFIDDLCIEEDSYLTCEELSAYANFNLASSSTDGNIITSLSFEANNPVPYGVSHWWQIYEAENCEDIGFTILNEYSADGDFPLRDAAGEATFVVESPNANFPDNDIKINRCYIVKHGLYYWDGNGCKWVEKRGKLRVSFSPGQRNKGLEFIPQQSVR